MMSACALGVGVGGLQERPPPMISFHFVGFLKELMILVSLSVLKDVCSHPALIGWFVFLKA